MRPDAKEMNDALADDIIELVEALTAAAYAYHMKRLTRTRPRRMASAAAPVPAERAMNEVFAFLTVANVVAATDVKTSS